MRNVLHYLDSVYVILFLLVFVLTLVVLYLVLQKRYSKLKSRLDQFVRGKDAKSLEEEIASLYKDNKEIHSSVVANRQDISRLNDEFNFAYQKLGVIKYDAFSQVGGQLSFSLALLDRNNDGFLLNSVHSTDGCYCYTKEIRKGSSVVMLSQEEMKALKQAMKEER
ncbi:MAG: DUF4446 family protein [Lachnospiraceae bacterium]|jgi:hypothetical protein|nr:DUF4446 family protein [Lachnospiraceae bacterium]